MSLALSEELQYIYSALRKLNYIPRVSQPNQVRGFAQLFSRKFLHKLLEERLNNLNDLAVETSLDLFKQIGGDKQLKLSTLTRAGGSLIEPTNIKNLLFPELDEFFHFSLYHLHDFFIDLDWHEPDLDQLSKSDLDYIKAAKLHNVENFYLFQRTLTDLVQQSKKPSSAIKTERGGFYVQKVVGGGSSPASPRGKSILKSDSSPISASSGASSNRSMSPTRRRVRFRDSSPGGKDDRGSEAITEQDFRDGQSMFALDLFLFALNLLIQRLTDKLVDWFTTAKMELESGLRMLIESKQKLKTNQLQAVAKKIKVINDAHLTILEFFAELRLTYLMDWISDALVARDPEPLIRLQKAPRISMFAQKVSVDVESKIILRLAKHCQQVLMDLMIGEINLMPIELASETKTKSREDLAKGEENLLNFLTNWLNVDDILFGYAKSKSNKRELVAQQQQQLLLRSQNSRRRSNLSSGVHFRSSSRILNQMENLGELMRQLIVEISRRIRYTSQLRYFFELILGSFEHSFDQISKKLLEQLNEAKADRLELAMIDSIAAKVRCLKFIHIMDCVERTLNDIPLRLDSSCLRSKLDHFIRVYSRNNSNNNNNQHH